MEYSYRFVDKEPMPVVIDFDKYPCGAGLKDLRITINGKKFCFSKEKLERILTFLNEVE